MRTAAVTVSRTLSLLAIGATLALGACATTASDPEPLTPISRYALQVEPGLDRIALAVHEAGVSPAQRAALGDLAYRFRAEGASALIVQSPGGEDPVADRHAWAVAEVLKGHGVPEAALKVEAYAAPDPRAPVLAGFETLQARIPNCSLQHGDLSARISNGASRGLGCSVNANLAAQIANPRDIIQPRDMAPAEMGRAAVVFANYRQGARTAAPREELVAARLAKAVE